MVEQQILILFAGVTPHGRIGRSEDGGLAVLEERRHQIIARDEIEELSNKEKGVNKSGEKKRMKTNVVELLIHQLSWQRLSSQTQLSQQQREWLVRMQNRRNRPEEKKERGMGSEVETGEKGGKNAVALAGKGQANGLCPSS
jgi:hypothetical protein